MGYRCRAPDEDRCQGLQSRKLLSAYQDRFVLNESNMDVAEEAQSVAGRIVFFLAENVHAVTPISEERDVLFVWMSCRAIGPTDTIASRRLEIQSFEREDAEL